METGDDDVDVLLGARRQRHVVDEGEVLRQRRLELRHLRVDHRVEIGGVRVDAGEDVLSALVVRRAVLIRPEDRAVA